MKRRASFILAGPSKRRRVGIYRRPNTRPAYQNLVVARPQRAMAPLASRGYRLNNVERKVADIAVTLYGVNTTGSFTLMAKPQLGSDMTDRIGRKIQLKSFYIRGFVATEAALNAVVGVNPTMQARMIIFVDLQPNGAVPVVTDLLNTASPASHLNLSNRDRFKIYCDKTFVFDPYLYSTTATQAYASASNQIFQIKKFKKINLEMVFNGTNGGTIADITSGALYMFWIGSVVSGANTDMNASVGTRVRYSDN